MQYNRLVRIASETMNLHSMAQSQKFASHYTPYYFLANTLQLRNSRRTSMRRPNNVASLSSDCGIYVNDIYGA